MGKLLEGYWDCSQCGHKAVRGSLRECPSCGKARGEDTKFYMRDRVYVDEETSKTVSRRPDWFCSFCNQLNSDDATYCVSCGASKSDSDATYFEMRQAAEKKAMSRKANSTVVARQVEEENNRRKLKYIGISVIVGLILLLSILGIRAAMQPKEVSVIGFSWEKTLSIEEYKTVYDSDWSLPYNARLIRTQSEIHSYQDVLDYYDTRQVAKERISGYHTEVTGQRDLGNGYFEEITTQVADYETYYELESVPVYRSEPVYKQKYYYEYDTWVVVRTVTSRGDDKNDYIGDYVLSEPYTYSGLGEERVGVLSETYRIHTDSSKGDAHTYTVSKEDWDYLQLGTQAKIKTGLLGKATVVK